MSTVSSRRAIAQGITGDFTVGREVVNNIKDAFVVAAEADDQELHRRLNVLVLQGGAPAAHDRATDGSTCDNQSGVKLGNTTSAIMGRIQSI